MGLQTKLGLALGALAALALALGLHAAALLGQLGDAIDVVLRENYRSARAMQDAKEGLERLDSAALLALLGETDEAQGLAEANVPVVRAAVETQLGNLTLPGERERAEALRDGVEAYVAALPAVLGGGPGARAAYDGDLRPRFDALKAEAAAILQMNQQAMVEANARARAEAAAARQRLFALVLGALALAAGVLALVGRLVVRPVRRLTEAARDVRAGNLERTVAVESADEVGQLSEAFNDLTAALRDVRRSDRARLLRAQRASQATLDALPSAVAVLDRRGTVELANATARRLFGLTPGSDVRDARAALADLAAQPTRQLAADALDTPDPIQAFDDGRERFFAPQAVRLRADDGAGAGTLLVLADVTDRRASAEMRADALARAAHEIGTPLTSLRMALHLLLEEKTGALDPKQAELLVTAREDADALARLADSLTPHPAKP